MLTAFVTPSWSQALVSQSHSDAPKNTMAAEAWIERNLPPGDVVIVYDYMLVDLKTHGTVQPVWFYKVDLDPAVMAHTLPDGWRSIGYIVSDPEATGNPLWQLTPTLHAAFNHAVVAKKFGNEVTVYRVEQ